MADPERFDADPDPTFQADADPDPAPAPDPIFSPRERKKFSSKSSITVFFLKYYQTLSCLIFSVTMREKG